MEISEINEIAQSTSGRPRGLPEFDGQRFDEFEQQVQEFEIFSAFRTISPLDDELTFLGKASEDE